MAVVWSNITWRPGIGDPELLGWLTVVLYAVAAGLCFRAWKAERRLPGPSRPRFWLFLTCALVLLGINKQLDMQSLFTQVAREIVRAEGWLDQRRELQLTLIIGVALAALLTIVAWIWYLHAHGPRYVLAIVGFVLLAAFVVIRAASFHHVDHFIGQRLWIFKMNHLLEMGSLSVLCLGAHLGARAGCGASRQAMPR
jgi:hypothetical protein